MDFLGMSPLELMVIVALALIVLGPERLPELARQAGRTLREVRRISSEVRGELSRSLELDGPAQAPPPVLQSDHTIAPVPHTATRDFEVRPPY